MNGHRRAATGPLPRPAFRSFLATAVDPSPNFGGGVVGQGSEWFGRCGVIVGMRSAAESAARPLRSLRLVPPPKKTGGGWVAEGSRLDDGDRTGVRRCAPPPAPPRSFLTERGEVDPASTASGAHGTSGTRHPSPEVGGGVAGRCEERAKGPAGERARRSGCSFGMHRTGVRQCAPPPTPPRSFLTERGEVDPAAIVSGAHRTVGTHHPSPEVGGGVAGRCEERAKGPAGERAPTGARQALLSAFSVEARR